MAFPPDSPAPPPGYGPPGYGPPHAAPIPPGGYPPPYGPPPRRSQTPVVVGVVVVALALIGATVLVLSQRDAGDTPGESYAAASPPAASAPTASTPTAPAPSASAPSPADAPAASATPAPAPAPSPATTPPAPASPAPAPRQQGTTVTTGRWSSAAPNLGQDCSVPDRDPATQVTVEFVNQSQHTLAISFTDRMDMGCGSDILYTLAPGQSRRQPTYAGALWEAGDGEGMSYAGFIATGASTRWVIQ